ncbi:hypothetical protein SNOG_13549 [Parastagonospora nodorum SN15]|uniref:Uncharacterized protein n=1 Tax=Phaeosphaeria nodorum (strain SN15 / ATCC MYA-4574 / FGSC 10173) TaxID=321614 RepID=Q0U3W5_PHANO|nr:hypothetical protein SNOG_13549 [Parastagonospora nodorum SN15]EAT78996.1 hypothetical protein SNOG_13549 [Parastagonospora nodorum SN15]
MALSSPTTVKEVQMHFLLLPTWFSYSAYSQST